MIPSGHNQTTRKVVSDDLAHVNESNVWIFRLEREFLNELAFLCLSVCAIEVAHSSTTRCSTSWLMLCWFWLWISPKLDRSLLAAGAYTNLSYGWRLWLALIHLTFLLSLWACSSFLVLLNINLHKHAWYFSCLHYSCYVYGRNGLPFSPHTFSWCSCKI